MRYAEPKARSAELPSAAIDALTNDSAVIDDAALRCLYKHADKATTERIGDEFQRFMSGVEESAAPSGNHADLLGAQLTGLSAALESSAGPFSSDLAATA